MALQLGRLRRRSETHQNLRVGRTQTEPALELDAGLGRAFAILEFVQGCFGAVHENFVINDRGVECRDEFEEIGLAFEDVYEEIGIVRGQGAELVEERLFGGILRGDAAGGGYSILAPAPLSSSRDAKALICNPI